MAVAKAKAQKPATTKARGKKAGQDHAARMMSVAILLKQISDPTRLLVVLTLAQGERHVGALCDELGFSQPALSHHLALMRHGSIVTARRQGKNSFYSLTEIGQELAQVVDAMMG